VRAALTSLDVGSDRPPAHLDEDGRQLRRGLRAKARQLGDVGNKLDSLVAECAYEQWHRLLFARFLTENNLLIHPEYRAPVTLDDCSELAESLGEPDGWSVAARFAAEILPGIFRLDDPCFRLRVAPEGRLSLEGIIAGVPGAVFAADDALGWVYQFWQKDKKDEVNASEQKIGGADLSPVTQLFTENYMVRFLLENSLGAWWAARHPDSPIVKDFEYLRVNDDGQPAAGGFGSWPNCVAEVTVMDPCCGSGHFLVEAFSMLWRMRAEEEVLAPTEAQDAVLRDNLFGLELDPRCVQIAGFAIAIAAWKASSGWRELPVPKMVCSGIPTKIPFDEWKVLAEGDARLENALLRLHILFRDADSLGSLIDPKRTVEISDPTGQQSSIEDVDWEDIAPLLQQAAVGEISEPALGALGTDAVNTARAADLLSRRYTLVATNVPYLSSVNQSELLKNHLSRYFADAKADLATAFMDRCRGLAKTSALVTPQNWLFLQAYRSFRQRVLDASRLSTIARLGSGAFAGITGEVVKPCLFIADHSSSSPMSNRFVAIELDDRSTPHEKATELATGTFALRGQAMQLRNPDCRIVLADVQSGSLLQEFATAYWGLGTGDDVRYVRRFWELPTISHGWVRHQGTVAETIPYGGRERVLRWEGGCGALADEPGAFIRGLEVWGSRGVAVSQTGALPATLYTGEAWNQNCAPIIPLDDKHLPAIWAYCSSDEFQVEVRKIDRSLKVTNATLVKVPFDYARWQTVAEKAGPLPEPFTDDPTQWLFKGDPAVSAAPLQVAAARLVGYRWPEQAESDGLDGFQDSDGIVCLPSVAGEAPAVDRLHQMLAAAFGQSWSPAKQTELLELTGSKKKTLGNWLRDEFFKQHCALFQNRPVVWQIWDGQRDGFAALVNYHLLDRKTLEKLTYTYLGDWIERQRAEVREQVAGAEARLAAASTLRKSLELILDGERPYDIYVRWKSLAEQPIGWDPDVNDGVRVNVRPFVEARVLRSSFSIHWRKDRGRNPDGSERLNDLHFTTFEKRSASGGKHE
jgi:hypothetical protein